MYSIDYTQHPEIYSARKKQGLTFSAHLKIDQTIVGTKKKSSNVPCFRLHAKGFGSLMTEKRFLPIQH